MRFGSRVAGSARTATSLSAFNLVLGQSYRNLLCDELIQFLLGGWHCSWSCLPCFWWHLFDYNKYQKQLDTYLHHIVSPHTSNIRTSQCVHTSQNAHNHHIKEIASQDMDHNNRIPITSYHNIHTTIDKTTIYFTIINTVTFHPFSTP